MMKQGNCNMTLKNRLEVLNTLGCGNSIEDMLEARVNEMGSDEFDKAVADDELMMKKAIKFRLCGKAYAMSILDFSKRLGYDKVQKNEIWLLSMFEANHQNGYANFTWLIAKWMKKKGVGTQRESLICCGQFVMRIAKRLGILSDEVLIGLSAPTYFRTLDANILRELIGSNGRLIPEEIAPSIPRVATPRA
ncbi:hypothetical protein Tco_1182692 [Tanacetum coccineum]